MLKTIKTLSLATAFSIAGGLAAQAATFDFVAMADDNSNAHWIGNVELNWADAFPLDVTIDGITLMATGSNVDNVDADAFFDQGNAGLGVCSTPHATPGSSGCATGIGSDTSDDNVQGTAGGETLTLDFGQIVDFTDILFNDDGHIALTGSLLVNGGAVTVVNGLVTNGFSFLTGQSVYNLTYTSSQFYLASATVSPVPIPAAGLLLLGALGGLRVATRRRRRA